MTKHDYMGDGIYIRYASDATIPIHVSVTLTSYDSHVGTSVWHGSKGSMWRKVTADYTGCSFKRSGWETVVFKDTNNTRRKGFYVQPLGKSIYMTFHNWDNIEVTNARPKH
ncbi:hypothetical protein OF83DRAFT_1167977 [Amylostereum chailletii]|nr:hypothetical protein OF83DRAFT_1167977 [Amylostereum chailletii]